MIGFGIPHGWEMLIVLVVILLLFGHRLPGMARSLGTGITEFKRGLRDGKENDSAKVEEKSTSTPGSENKGPEA